MSYNDNNNNNDSYVCNPSHPPLTYIHKLTTFDRALPVDVTRAASALLVDARRVASAPLIARTTPTDRLAVTMSALAA